jgi:hypothetical protein
MRRNLIKSIIGDYLVSLGDAEGDFRLAQLRSEIRQSILYMSLVSFSILALLRVDAILFADRPDLFMMMCAYRGGFVIITILFGFVLQKVEKVKVYDRLTFGWISLTILFLLLFNFTRPANYLTASFDVIVPFAIYMLSPLKIKSTVALAWGFSVGTLYIDHFFKSGIDPITLQVATTAQVIVNVLGLLFALQLQTYRRKSFVAYIDDKVAKEMVEYLANFDPLTMSLSRRHFFS